MGLARSRLGLGWLGMGRLGMGLGLRLELGMALLGLARICVLSVWVLGRASLRSVV